MSLWSAIVTLLKGDAVKEWKFLMAEIKEMRDEYKKEAKEQKKTIDENRERIKDMEDRITHLEVLEQECLANYRTLMQQYHDLKERLIFKTRGKHKDDEL